MKKILLILLLTIGYHVSNAQVMTADTAAKGGRKSMLIGPLFMYFNLDRGQTAKQTLHFVNNKNKTYRYTFNIVDFMVDSSGSNRNADSAALEYSLASWISLEQNYLEVGPNQRASIDITVKVPDNEEAVKSMKWAKVLATPVPEDAGVTQPSGRKVKIKQSISVGAQIFNTPPNLSKDLKMLAFTQLNDSVFSIKCQNTGGQMLRARFSIELTSAASIKNKTKIGDDEEIRILPNHVRVVNLKRPPGLAPGKYTAIGMVDAGEDVALEAAQLIVDLK
ncbi:MAG TPA: hypothetical protein VEB40_07630 [Flavipsychrobacter sp.]|nr:hypothetical protein [Flavipsychrobacter sp.]